MTSPPDGVPSPPPHSMPSSRAGRWARVSWTVVSYLVVQSAILGIAALPAALVLHWATPYLPASTWGRVVAGAIGLLPMYLLFGGTLAVTTALALRALRWRTVPGLVLPIAEFGWPLMRWARRAMCTHVVRILVGTAVRGSTLWSWFVRMNGARVGRGVWINSLAVTDHDLLSFGDGAVIGHDVHLSGHTVEAGCVRTGTVRVGRGATIGVGSVIGIDVEIGDYCLVGALSLVPKRSHLAARSTYVGIPVRRLPSPHEGESLAAPPHTLSESPTDSRTADRGAATNR